MTKPQTQTPEEEEKSWPVEVTSVIYDKHSPQLTLLGHVESPSTSELTAAIDADVIRTLVKEGQTVDQRQVLVELDPVEAKLDLSQREADVEDMEAQLQIENNDYQAALKAIEDEKNLLELNKTAVTREKRLLQKKLGSKSRLDESQMSLEQQALATNERQLFITNHESRVKKIEANLKRAFSLLARANLDLQRTKIRAPFSGRISKLDVSIGERVKPGTPLIAVYAIDKLEVRALIPERYLVTISHALENHDPLVAKSKYLRKDLIFRLDRFAGSENQARGGTDGIFSLEGQSTTLPLGKAIQITLNLPPIPNTIGIPKKSIFMENKVYKIVNNRLSVVNIKRLGETKTAEGTPIVIAKSDGLAPGDRYITTQLPNPVTGLKVSVIHSQPMSTQ